MGSGRISYRWMPLEDLPTGWERLASLELRSLSTVWADQRERLQKTERQALTKFHDELRRDWCIEMGALEGHYTLDADTKQALIEKGIEAALIPSLESNRSPELVAATIRDHDETIERLFDFCSGTREISPSYVKELHACLTVHQFFAHRLDSVGRVVESPMVRGAYKMASNNHTRQDDSMHEYCPPEHTISEMDRLFFLHEQHVAQNVPPEVEAAWLHHRFTQIHPFVDGNGRVARTLATLVFLKERFLPLVVRREDRYVYLRALQAADRGDLTPLVNLFVRIQRKAFLRGLTITGKMLTHDTVDQVVASLRGDLEKARQMQHPRWDRTKSYCDQLLERVQRRLTAIQGVLTKEIADLLDEPELLVDEDRGDRGHFNSWQVIQTARKLGYFANYKEVHRWARLVLRTDQEAEILVSFHGLGHDYRGICAASACFSRRAATEQGNSEILDVTPLSDEVFQFNYLETIGEIASRFTPWMDSILIRGLEIWRRPL